MTNKEICNLMHNMCFYEVYINNKDWESAKTLDEVDDNTFDIIIEYFKNCTAPYEVVYQLLVDDDFVPATMDNEKTGDEWDNAEIWIRDGKVVNIGCWTEVLGITYWLDGYGTKWKLYEKTDEDYKREAEEEEKRKQYREEHDSEYEALLRKITDSILPPLVHEDPAPSVPMNDSLRAAYKAALVGKIMSAEADIQARKIDAELKEIYKGE